MTDITEFLVKVVLRALLYGLSAVLLLFGITANEGDLLAVLSPLAAGLVGVGAFIVQVLVDRYFHKRDIAKTS